MASGNELKMHVRDVEVVFDTEKLNIHVKDVHGHGLRGETARQCLLLAVYKNPVIGLDMMGAFLKGNAYYENYDRNWVSVPM